MSHCLNCALGRDPGRAQKTNASGTQEKLETGRGCWCRKKVARGKQTRIHLQLKLTAIVTSIGHFICDHDTRSLHYNGAIFMFESERLACNGRQSQ